MHCVCGSFQPVNTVSKACGTCIQLSHPHSCRVPRVPLVTMIRHHKGCVKALTSYLAPFSLRFWPRFSVPGSRCHVTPELRYPFSLRF